jgi:hypothetical protein
MWIKFTSIAPFAIKAYVGSVNTISGKSFAALQQPSDLEPIQDYVVVPEQPWLDGKASDQSGVMQFVDTKLGDGYSVEAYVPGDESYSVSSSKLLEALSTLIKRERCT